MLTLHDDLCAKPRCPGTWSCWCSGCCSPGRAVSRSRGKRDSAWPCAPLSSSPPPRRSCSSSSPSRKRGRDLRTPSSGPCTVSLRENRKTESHVRSRQPARHSITRDFSFPFFTVGEKKIEPRITISENVRSHTRNFLRKTRSSLRGRPNLRTHYAHRECPANAALLYLLRHASTTRSADFLLVLLANGTDSKELNFNDKEDEKRIRRNRCDKTRPPLDRTSSKTRQQKRGVTYWTSSVSTKKKKKKKQLKEG